MTEVEAHLKTLDMAIWELSEAFKDLPDEDLWKRPHPNLLSIGELGSHIAFGEADSFLGNTAQSPLLVAQTEYYTKNIGNPFTAQLSAKELYEEVTRIHALCKDTITTLAPAPEDPNPHREGWTWGFALQYQVFHVSYHTGQIYSVRHLLGHETPDN